MVQIKFFVAFILAAAAAIAPVVAMPAPTKTSVFIWHDRWLFPPWSYIIVTKPHRTAHRPKSSSPKRSPRAHVNHTYPGVGVISRVLRRIILTRPLFNNRPRLFPSTRPVQLTRVVSRFRHVYHMLFIKCVQKGQHDARHGTVFKFIKLLAWRHSIVRKSAENIMLIATK